MFARSKTSNLSIVENRKASTQGAQRKHEAGELSCKKVYCDCEPPQFEKCHKTAGILELLFPGVGLYWFCCYGRERSDCCGVCMAGVFQSLTGVCFVGMISSQCVAYKMMNWIQPEQRESSAQQRTTAQANLNSVE